MIQKIFSSSPSRQHVIEGDVHGMISAFHFQETYRTLHFTPSFPLSTLKVHSRRITDAAFSPDGCKVLSASEDQHFAISDFDPDTGRLRHRDKIDVRITMDLVAWSPAGHVFALLSDHGAEDEWFGTDGFRCLDIYDVTSIDRCPQISLETVVPLQITPTELSFSECGRRVKISTSNKDTKFLFDLATGHELS